MFEIKPYWQNYIDGAWVDGGAGRIDVTDPATGNVIAQHALADAGDVDRAVMAARRVHLSGVLTDMRPIERGRMVQAMGRFLTEHRERLAYLLSREQGKPILNPKSKLMVQRFISNITAIRPARLRGVPSRWDQGILISRITNPLVCRRRLSRGTIHWK